MRDWAGCSSRCVTVLRCRECVLWPQKKRLCERVSSECVCDVTAATGFPLGVHKFMYKGPEMSSIHRFSDVNGLEVA